jgi:hypothetical protein
MDGEDLISGIYKSGALAQNLLTIHQTSLLFLHLTLSQPPDSISIKSSLDDPRDADVHVSVRLTGFVCRHRPHAGARRNGVASQVAHISVVSPVSRIRISPRAMGVATNGSAKQQLAL